MGCAPKAATNHVQRQKFVTEEGICLLLPTDWKDISDQNEGRPTFTKGANVLQVSAAIYRSGQEPRPTKEELIELASGFVGQKGAKIVSTDSGTCQFGLYGTALYTTEEFPHFQVWELSNGLDFIMVTSISQDPLSADEKLELDSIIQVLGLEKPSPEK